MIRNQLLATLFWICSGAFCAAWGAHGLSIDGVLKYPPGFKQFDYVSSQAQKGGHLVLQALGSFDKMNPFTLKGTEPDGLGTYVFEPLAQASLDEPFAQYGLVAKDIAIAEDYLSVVFTVDERARFSDGTPITAEDVKYSLDMLKSDLAHPLYPYYYADITGAEVLDRYRVRFNFKQVNRELPLIAGQIQVMSRKFYEQVGFGGTALIAPVASGPYIVDSFKLGKSITYRRNPDYWATDHPVRKGMYNFDRITIKYYKDQIVAVEAFKAGEFDFMLVNIAKQWARDMTGGKFASGEIIKEKFPHRNNAGMQGFVMNTRRPVFQDPVVRQALGLAFDFEWTNEAIFFDQYVRSTSYFSNSYLAAPGLPSPEELKLLEPFRHQLPEAVFTQPLSVPTTDRPGGLRANLQKAVELLTSRGFRLKDGVMTNEQGVRLSFEIILVSQSFERVMAGYARNLKKIGIEASYRTIDPALYTDRLNNFDFDMCVFVYGQSLSPGNEQRNYWHSESADTAGSRNLAGIKNPAVDFLVERIIYADNQIELTAACRALDRVLWYGYYLVPNWYMDSHRLAFHNKFSIPETIPLYYDPTAFLMTWWMRQ